VDVRPASKEELVVVCCIERKGTICFEAPIEQHDHPDATRMPGAYHHDPCRQLYDESHKDSLVAEMKSVCSDESTYSPKENVRVGKGGSLS
jgi:hypothetical protein